VISGVAYDPAAGACKGSLDVTDSYTIIDNRTGKSVEVPIEDGGVAMSAVRQLDPSVFFYDPAFMQTAACRSSITLVDGDAGILRYRGYPIQELAEKSTFLEVAYLLLHGELPSREQFDKWVHDVTYHTYVHENVRKRFIDGFHHDAHPMGILVATVAALSTFYPEAKNVADREVRLIQVNRLIAKMPTLAAFAHRFSVGLPMTYPDNALDYASNFLSMMWKIAEPRFEADPVLTRALDILFILHADHEQNCSTTAMRVVGSAQADPYSAVSAACAALYGPLHGGANEAVVRMLTRIGSMDNIPAYVAQVKEGKEKLMGFGHRVYKNYDPRARIIKQTAEDVFAVTGRNPLLDIALKLEEIALADEYFISRKLYPNVDFYSGLIYQAMGFPIAMFPVLFAIPRTAGWCAHWLELLQDPDQKISRPRQLYTGAPERPYQPLDQRQ
jgi:citrate synthase